MKVVLVSHGHPAFSIGGAEVASYNLFNALNRRPDSEAHYLAHVGPPIAPHRDTPFLNLRQSQRETLFFADSYDLFRLSNRDVATLDDHLGRFLAELRPDVVHLHHVLGFGAEMLHLVRKVLPQAKIVFTLHEYLAICGNHGQMIKASTGALCHRASPAECAACLPQHSAAAFMRRELFVKAAFERVDAFVSPSRFLLQRFVAWGLPAAKLCLLENGLEAGPAAPPRPLPRQGGLRNRFAYFGQLNPFKGIRTLLEAIIRVPADVWGSDSVLDVFGGNLEVQPEAFQQEFRRLVAAAGRRARFFGSYRSADIAKLMAGIDWVIVPSTWWENSPVVIQEAFAHGRPVICSDIGGMAEKVRDNVHGLHFRGGSIDSLTERLVGVLRAPDAWGRLRDRIRPPLSADEAAGQHFALYQNLARGRRQPKAGADAPSTRANGDRLAVAAE